MARLSASSSSKAAATAIAAAAASSSTTTSTNGHPVASDTPDAVTMAAIPIAPIPSADIDSDDEPHFAFNRTPSYAAKAAFLPYDPTLLPTGIRSLSSISLQAFFLGIILAGSILASLYLVLNKESPWWRLPAFLASLSIFHFLEFWTTAHFNLPAARTTSFLLFSNGTAYNVAHLLATVEIIALNLFPTYHHYAVYPFTIALGLALMLIGQVVRSVAMAQAGTNFNHIPQRTRKEGHELVTTGMYAYLRHPSYFGFFWWALGTQLLVGNKVCLVGYAVVLWRFFSGRIKAEERLLVRFFGGEYEKFRERKGTGIPFVR